MVKTAGDVLQQGPLAACVFAARFLRKVLDLIFMPDRTCRAFQATGGGPILWNSLPT